MINSFDDNQVIESVSFENRPGVNLIKDKNYFSAEFYKINYVPKFDDNTIYLGSEDEKKDYFHKMFLEFKEKIESREEEFKINKDKLQLGEKKINEYEGSIRFKEQLDDNKGKYDVIIDINSILALYGEGWDIKYPIGKEDYEKKLQRESIIVGVLGNRNKGKSFILSKLSGYEIKQGFSLKTEGISVKFSEADDNKFLTILDSAGQEVPLLNSENKKVEAKNEKIEEKNEKEAKKEKEEKEANNKIEEKNEKEAKNEREEKNEIEAKGEIEEKKEINNIQNNNDNIQNNNNININAEEEFNKDSVLEQCLRDKLITEKFIEDFIIFNSNILILVIGSITLNEQKLMKRIKNSLRENQRLFVIHNLQNFYTKEQVNDYVENTLKKLFGLKIRENKFYGFDKDLNDKYYVETDKSVTHLIFVNAYCDITDYYNKPTYEYLKSKLIGVEERTKFSVIERCKEFFLEKQEKFLSELISKEDFTQENNKLSVKNKKISLKRVFVDEIGETIINDSDIPNYHYYTLDKDLIVNVELPGPNPEILTRSEVQGGFQVFYFKGKTADFTSEINNKKSFVSKNIKKAKEFQFIFRISASDIKLLPNDEGEDNYYYKSESNDKGIITFKYHIKDRSKKGGFK